MKKTILATVGLAALVACKKDVVSDISEPPAMTETATVPEAESLPTPPADIEIPMGVLPPASSKGEAKKAGEEDLEEKAGFGVSIKKNGKEIPIKVRSPEYGGVTLRDGKYTLSAERKDVLGFYVAKVAAPGNLEIVSREGGSIKFHPGTYYVKVEYGSDRGEVVRIDSLSGKEWDERVLRSMKGALPKAKGGALGMPVVGVAGQARMPFYAEPFNIRAPPAQIWNLEKNDEAYVRLEPKKSVKFETDEDETIKVVKIAYLVEGRWQEGEPERVEASSFEKSFYDMGWYKVDFSLEKGKKARVDRLYVDIREGPVEADKEKQRLAALERVEELDDLRE